MDNQELKHKVGAAAKWSSMTEVVAKLVTPITTMILARLLSPEAFGVVATVAMIVSFADMLSNSGFANYLVQREFSDEKHRAESTNVAFWSNMSISLVLWIIIIIFRDFIAARVGNPGLGMVLVVACLQLPITAFSSIQMALFKRAFDFKTLFIRRIVAICLPFVVTIPLAIIGWSYWALIIGSICGTLVNAILLTTISKWKPRFFYSFSLLKEMISFSTWSLIEAISIWLTGWVDIFIIGSALNTYYLGLYRTSLITVGQIFGIITASTTPLLFAALSRLQNNDSAFTAMFLKMQRMVAYFVFPIGMGMYLYSNVVTQIILGSKWAEATNIIGIWALTSAVMITLGNYSSEVYRSKGNPRLSFIAQMLHLIVLVPTCIISLKYGFWVLVYARALIRLQFVVVHLFIMKYAVKFPIGKMLPNLAKPIIFTMLMCSAGLGLQHIYSTFRWSLVSIGICTAIYFGLMGIFARDEVKSIAAIFFKKRAVQKSSR